MNIFKVSIASMLFWLSFVLSFSHVQLANAQWVQTRVPGLEQLEKIHKIDETYMTYSSKKLYRSDDYGWTWHEKHERQFIDEYTCFYQDRVYCQLAKDSVFYSDDKCDTWHFLTKNPITSGSKNLFADSLYLFAAENDYKLWRYDLSQNTWSIVLDNQYSNPFCDYMQGGEIWCKHFNGIIHSDDYGNTWEPVIEGKVNAYCVNGDSLFVAKSDSIYRSFDGGATWNSFASNLFPITTYTDMEYLSDGRLFKFNTSSTSYSYDWGLTWDSLPPGEVTDVMIDGAKFIVTAWNGMLVSLDNGVTWEAMNSGLLPIFSNNVGRENAYTSFGNHLVYNYYFWSADEGEHWGRMLRPSVKTVVEHQGKLLGLHDTGDSLVLMRTDIEDYKGWKRVYTQGAPDKFQEQFVVKGDTIFCLGRKNGASPISNNVVFCSLDGGNSWQQLTTSGLSNVGPNFAVHKGKLYIGTKEDLMIASSDGVTWTPVSLGIYPQESNFYGAMRLLSTKHFLFAYPTYDVTHSWIENDLFGSDDGGITWKHLDFPLDMTYPTLNLLQNGFKVKEVTVDPITETVYAMDEDKRLYSSNGLSMNWTNIGTDTLSDFCNIFHLHFFKNKLYFWGAANYNNTSCLLPVLWRLGMDNLSPVSGRVYKDVNNNGVQDNGEPGIKDAVLNIRNTGDHFETFENGDFLFYAPFGNDTLGIMKPNIYAQINPPMHPLSGQDSALQFAVYYPPNITDLAVNVSVSAPFRPAFYGGFAVTVENLGTEPSSGVLHILLTSAVTYTNLPIGSTMVGDTILLPFGPIPVDSSFSWQIGGELPADEQLLGDTLLGLFWVETTVQDTMTANNIATVATIIVGSYDPNDKHSKSEPYYLYTDLPLGKPIEYTIRFQNTGTYYATNVTVIDKLEEKILTSSFNFIGSSHPCTWSMGNDGELTFDFKNILLPDSSTNEPGSHGYIQFSILPKPGVVPGDVISNKAAIYFDYNSPIITNASSFTIWDAFESFDISIDSNECERIVLNGYYPNASYLWSNGDTASTTVAEASGWLHLSITTPFGDVHYDSIYADVIQNDIALTAFLIHPTCTTASNGHIDLQVTSAASQTFEYLWSNGYPTQDLYSMTGGSYAVTVTTPNGCTASQTIQLVAPPALEVESQSSNTSCPGEHDGQVVLTSTGGTGSHSYQWSTGQTTPELNGLAPGNYYWTITDANGCFKEGIIIINSPAPPELIFSNVENVNCFGGADGAISLVFDNSSGGYSVEWYNGMVGDTIDGLPAGQYGFNLLFGEGCIDSFTDDFLINEPAPLSIELNGLNPDIGEFNGSINTIVNGGTPPYTYQWVNGFASDSIFNLAVGNYSLTVTDANDCQVVDSIFLEATSATSDIAIPYEIRVQPNPVHEWLTIEITPTIHNVQEFRIYNSIGQLMECYVPSNGVNGSFHKYDYYVGNWPRGIYFIQFVNEVGDFAIQEFLIVKRG